jgi:hypothetical protein
MSDYFTAYRNRLKNNHETFVNVSNQLKENGCEVYAPKDGFINFIKVIKDGKHVILGFTEVPYRWYLSVSTEPKPKGGSGYTIKEIHGTENPFTIEDIMSSMRDNPKNFPLNYLQKI